MKRANVTHIDFEHGNWTNRNATNIIVIHHTGASTDIDVGVETINQWHLNNGWAGCGYHFVIRKNGSIEEGRPHWVIGSHAYGRNNDSIGIHFSGSFDIAQPTEAQIESGALLLANLCCDYGLPIDSAHILPHYAVSETSCPGLYLDAMIPTLIGKANWYANN